MSATNDRLMGLVLAGGLSTRMGVDKALIDYHGKSQLETTFNLLSEFCEQVYVSVSHANQHELNRQKHPTILDAEGISGPLAGISSALKQFPNQSFLVIACDLPLLNSSTLKFLIEHRNTQKYATAFISEFDGLPEPLCCIWESDIMQSIFTSIEKGIKCPRKVLLNTDIELLDLPVTHALDNINTPEERVALKKKL